MALFDITMKEGGTQVGRGVDNFDLIPFKVFGTQSNATFAPKWNTLKHFWTVQLYMDSIIFLVLENGPGCSGYLQ